MNTLLLCETQIRLFTDPAFGTQIIAIENTELGRRLVALLGPGDLVDGCWMLDHSPEVDELLIGLVDVLVTMRYNHPRLMQLQYALPGVLT